MVKVISDSPQPLVVGTRGSALALWQANTVLDLLRNAHPDQTWDLGIIKPEGDLDKRSSLIEIGGRGVFSSALQVALIEGGIDLAVHSTKDVPTLFPSETAIQAFPLRDDPRDAVISRHHVGLADLPRNPTVGTSSRRRAVQVLKLRSDAEIIDIRGNIDTRLRKAESEPYDAVILAAAGLERMGWSNRITEFLPFELCTPAPGQGAIAVETRIAPDPVAGLVGVLDNPSISLPVRLERGFLQAIGGGCTTPVGAYAQMVETNGQPRIQFWAMLASDDGVRVEHAQQTFSVDDAQDEIYRLAVEMLRSVRQSVHLLPQPAALRGRTVLETASDHLSRALADEIETAGATHLSAPMIEIEHLSVQPQSLDNPVDWIVLTSGNAVPALTSLLDGTQTLPSIAVVGEQTRRRVEAAGFKVDLVPEDQQASGLIAAFAEHDLSGKHIAVLQGNLAGIKVKDALASQGAIVQSIEAYRTNPVAQIAPETLGAIRSGHVDAAIFASPSAVMRFGELVGADLPALSGACLVAIGPVTAEAMTNHGLPAHVVASSPNAGAVIADLRAYFEGRLAGHEESAGRSGDNEVRGEDHGTPGN